MVSDVEVASFLSSGVDSSLVAAVSGCSRTFTVGFENEGALYDETACARELADKLKTDHRCRYITKREFTEAVPRGMYDLDEPLYSRWCCPGRERMRYSEAITYIWSLRLCGA